MRVSIYHITNEIVLMNLYTSVLLGILLLALVTMIVAYSQSKKLRKNAELGQSRLESIVKATKTAIWEYDIRNQVMKVSGYWSEMLGYNQGAFKAFNLDDLKALVHKEDWTHLIRAFQSVVENPDEDYNVEIRLSNRNGEYVWVRQVGNIVEFDRDHKPLKLSGFQIDVNDQKQTEAKAHSFQKLIQYAIEHNNAAVAIHDTNMDYLYVSQQYLMQFRVKNSDIIGKNHYEVFPDLPEKWREVHRKTLEGNVLRNDRDPYYRSDGTVDWTRWESRPWYNEDGSVGGVIIYTEVINQQLELEEVLRSQAEAIESEKKHAEATLMSIGDAVISTDHKGIITGFNTMSEALTEWPAEEAIGRPFDEIFNIINEVTRKSFDDPVKRVLKSKKRVELENHTILITKHNKEIYIEDSATPILNKKNELLGVVLVFRDVTDKVQMSKRLSIEKQRLSRVVESTADIIFEIDTNKRFVSIYGKGLKKINHKTETILNKTVVEVFGESGKRREKAYDQALKGSITTYQWEYETAKKTLYFEATVSPIYDENDGIIGAVGITRDITEAKLKQKEIEFLSYYDHLTELYNRRYFAEVIAKFDSEKQYPLGIVMIDLNGLKILNDAYGHGVGDIALKRVAEVLRSVGNDSMIAARIGGDEFAIVSPLTEEGSLEVLKDTILSKINDVVVENVQLSLAIGYALKHDVSEDIGDVMKAAEDAMYKRKLNEGISARNNTIKAILKTLTDKYNEEKVHSERVSRICRKIGEALKLKPDDIDALAMAGFYHDIGKISIPDAILEKPMALTDEEYEIIKSHTENGYQILRAADEYSDLAVDALYHHERFDGKGYPEGLIGEAIPLNSRIIAVADAYEAMTSDRSYRKALTMDYAIDELQKHSGTQFDPSIVNAFIASVKKKKDTF